MSALFKKVVRARRIVLSLSPISYFARQIRRSPDKIKHSPVTDTDSAATDEHSVATDKDSVFVIGYSPAPIEKSSGVC